MELDENDKAPTAFNTGSALYHINTGVDTEKKTMHNDKTDLET